jgi:hypothetical protein
MQVEGMPLPVWQASLKLSSTKTTMPEDSLRMPAPTNALPPPGFDHRYRGMLMTLYGGNGRSMLKQKSKKLTAKSVSSGP